MTAEPDTDEGPQSLWMGPTPFPGPGVEPVHAALHVENHDEITVPCRRAGQLRVALEEPCRSRSDKDGRAGVFAGTTCVSERQDHSTDLSHQGGP